MELNPNHMRVRIPNFGLELLLSLYTLINKFLSSRFKLHYEGLSAFRLRTVKLFRLLSA